MDASTFVQTVVSDAETIVSYAQKGLSALKDNPVVGDLVSAFPVLLPFEEKLIGLIPIAGQIQAGLELADLGLTYLPQLVALGAAVHFHSATGDELADLQKARGQDG